MSAISGVVIFGAKADPRSSCVKMANAQRAYGPHKVSVLGKDGAAFGHNLFQLLPEDVFDAQPLVGGEGRFFLTADIRLDNRSEILALLGVGGGGASALSDAHVLLMAYERWERGVVDRIVGDFAFAVYDFSRRELFLARDPLGQRPLHYHVGSAFVAFSSMPQGMHAIDEIPRRPNKKRLAEFILERPLGDSDSYFEGVKKVRPGHEVIVACQKERTSRFWNPAPETLHLRREEDYVDAFREQLDRAVSCRLRGSAGLIATHLSAGYDSSAVTTTAAGLMQRQDGRVLALTSAPRLGFGGPVPRGRIGDESALAAVTAARYPNVEHVIVRSNQTSPLDLLERSCELFQEPTGHVFNNIWWSALHDEVRRRGASIVLTGEAGNLTISAGGLPVLADLIRTGAWATWWREARMLAANGPMRWRGIFANSFGGWLPRPIWRPLSRIFLGGSSRATSAYLLRDEWLQRKGLVGDVGRDQRPGKDSYQKRLRLMRVLDPGSFRKGILAGWGVDERDPTSDRRLIEFCLSLPYDQLLKDGITRPLAKAALSDRLPDVVLYPTLRGYQTADWYESLSKDALMEEVRRIREDACASSLIDVDQVENLVARWPSAGWAEETSLSEFRRRLLRTISAAYFLRSARTGSARSEC